jgi:hypothetical protein
MSALLLPLVVALAASIAQQPPRATADGLLRHAAFECTGPASVEEANSLIVGAYVDGATTSVILTGLTCAAAAPAGTFTCVVNLPALTPGPHTMAIALTVGTATSEKSNVISFTYVVLAVSNLRIQ